jgi:hypothetical protein
VLNLLFRQVRQGRFAPVPAIALVLAAILSGFLLTLREPVVRENQIGNRPIQHQTGGFVSSDRCRACHPAQYLSWHRSFHRTMTQIASPESVAPSFDAVRVDALPAGPMILERRGRVLWADFIDPDRPGGGRIQRAVVMTTGSHNQQIFWYATANSRVLGQLPAIWLPSEQRWIPRRAAVMRPPGPPASETGAWNAVCVACHTTDGRSLFDTPFGSRHIDQQAADTTVAEFGVACEACHGPGDAHARVSRSPARRYWFHLSGRPDPTIVQPLRLEPRRSSQVCGQCHSVWEFRDAADERRANAQGLPYRPGDDLAATRFIVQPTSRLEATTLQAFVDEDPGFVRDVFWSDGMVRATGREYNGLIESPCYKNATDRRRTLSCFSCHTMHQSADDPREAREWADQQLAPSATGNDACLACHGSMRATVTTHTKHHADSSGSACYNCHMPFTTYGLLKTVRSHQISSPSVQTTVETGRPNACNLCHLDKTLAWTAGALNRWYGTAKPVLGEDDATIASALVTLLKGDAGQRAIAAQGMGWRPAQRASGTSWMAPYLALLLDDPYDAVRFIASRSLGGLPGFETLAPDFLAAPSVRLATRTRALEIWRDRRVANPVAPDAALLFRVDGTFNAPVVNRLMAERNTRKVVYRE